MNALRMITFALLCLCASGAQAQEKGGGAAWDKIVFDPYRITSNHAASEPVPNSNVFDEKEGGNRTQKSCPAWALNIGGASHHETAPKKNTFNEENPSLGLRVYGNETFLKGCPFLEVGYVFKNSVRGTTATAGGGVEWKLIEGKEVNLYGGVSVFYMDYYHPGFDDHWRGVAAAPYLSIGTKSVRLVAIPLGKDAAMFFVQATF